ncbi:MAG: hypothetical protein F3741_12665 [Nitrospinae bacterium]|nr:hypothetical protein [Nitrospinota bacterium]MZH42501.1 hypothetical protein [Nitrospinota bacterium]
MTRVTTISISLTMFLLLSILSIATRAQAQSCDEIAKSMKREGSEINKIQKRMIRAIDIDYEETTVYYKKKKKLDKNLKLLDRYNRGLNILVLNLEQQAVKMKGLLEKVKKQSNNCEKLVRKISDKTNTVQEVHAKMYESLGNKTTTEREFKDLINSLN